jgi:anaerobic ribonucleoside-triphosphate reductase
MKHILIGFDDFYIFTTMSFHQYMAIIRFLCEFNQRKDHDKWSITLYPKKTNKIKVIIQSKNKQMCNKCDANGLILIDNIYTKCKICGGEKIICHNKTIKMILSINDKNKILKAEF